MTINICGIALPPTATIIDAWGSAHESGVDVLFVAVRWDATTYRIIQRFRYEDSGDKSVMVYEHHYRTDENVKATIKDAMGELVRLGYSSPSRVPMWILGAAA